MFLQYTDMQAFKTGYENARACKWVESLKMLWHGTVRKNRKGADCLAPVGIRTCCQESRWLVQYSD